MFIFISIFTIIFMCYFYGTVNYINIMKPSVAPIFITSTSIIKRKRAVWIPQSKMNLLSEKPGSAIF